MARPAKTRNICREHQCRMFETENGSPVMELELDELEAIRLTDLEELDQEQAAECLGISRGTLQRLLYSAHRKIAFALVTGRSISIIEPNNVRSCCTKSTSCRFCPRRMKHKRKKGENEMIIAVTSENGEVFQHFGRTPEFTLFTVENNEVQHVERIPTGECGHGALAGFLRERKVDTLLCGGIGGGAQMALAEAGIKLVPGTEGPVEKVVDDYLNDRLVSNPNYSCHHHDHAEGHGCGHGCGDHDRHSCK